MKQLGIASLLLVSVLSCGFLYLFFSGRPPREDKLIANFWAHRSAYDRLRDMLQADKQLVRVASWGVETRTSLVSHVPPEGDFSVARYQEYLALLKEVGGLGASRGLGSDAEILVWASGWASNTRHIYIAWAEQQPSHLVSSLDEYYRTPKPRHPVYRRVDGNWYLWADW